jgi:hypothetical protein
MRFRTVLAFAALIFCSIVAIAQHITSPEEAFGFEPGTDRKLADWVQLTSYFEKVSRESDRVRYQELGKTTEGRPSFHLRSLLQRTFSTPTSIRTSCVGSQIPASPHRSRQTN